jgi:hypothetical protein
MNPSRTAMLAELRQAEFVQGDDQTGCRCETCDKPVPGPRGWWRRASAEYDEWDVYCVDCAYGWLHQYDDFDMEAFEALSTGNPG